VNEDGGPRRIPFRAMIPNAITALALCFGLTGVRFAVSASQGNAAHWQLALACVVAAGVLDGMDGRIARLLRADSKFGAELDSLSDNIAFGTAPALILFLWSLQHAPKFGWTAALALAVCCALRLARFNSQLGADPPPYLANFFSGAPAPAGAGLVMVPMFVSFEWGDWIARSPYLNGLWISGVALMMVSTVPTVSLKRIRIPHHLVVPTLLVIVLMTAFLTTAPWPTLIFVGLLYLASVPMTVRAASQARRNYEIRRSDPVETHPVAAPAPLPPANLPLGDARPPAGEWRH